MVSADKVVKIGDLGLAQQMNVLTSHRSLPFRWMAPESIAHWDFSSESDTWSYGIELWEIATLADFPYTEKKTYEEVVFRVANGDRLLLPDNCPDIFLSLTKNYWEAEQGSQKVVISVYPYW